MIALVESFYYELLLKLVDVITENNETAINSVLEEVGKFECSRLERDIFLDEFQGFVKRAKVRNSEGEKRKKALIKFLMAMPREEFYRLLTLLSDTTIQRIFNLCEREEFIQLFKGIFNIDLAELVDRTKAKGILVMIKDRSKV